MTPSKGEDIFAMKYWFIALFLCSALAHAAVVEVKMLNKDSNGQKMVFEPAVIKVNVGDSVKFLPTTKGHSVQSFKGKDSRPTGAKEFKSKLNKEFVYKVEHEGIHVIQCKPHYAMGMVGMIVAGKPTNLATIKKLKVRGKVAKKRFKAMLATFQ